MTVINNMEKTRQKGSVFVIALCALMFLTIFPDLAHATDADQSIKDGVAFGVKILKLIIYGLMGITFVVMIVLLIKSLVNWKEEGSRDGVGSIAGVVFVGLAVMGIIFLLGEQAITYIETNVVVTQIQPVINNLANLA